MRIEELKKQLIHADSQSFNDLTLKIFNYQSQNCPVYQNYLSLLQFDSTNVTNVEQIPFLPIELFKNLIVSDNSNAPEIVFESSSTTGTGISKHHVNDVQLYANSFVNCFNQNLGDFKNYCHLALLPSYLERSNSSLVYQINHFIENSNFKTSAFYLYNHTDLIEALTRCENEGIPTCLWGVSYALLDFAEKFSTQLNHTRVIETGGMKGRRKELTRTELHGILCNSFGVKVIYSEYGMTELLSQAYSLGNGLFQCSNTMKIHIREVNDPFSGPLINQHGAVNIIDLANIHSCSFIGTSDLGKVNENGQFEILGRIDHSDTRGCNLMMS